ncbi:MAG: hypothetical protein BWY10_00760 [Chloroflexi bacterium ADurb.Bin180]|nr:MAG: hypothetical protein BWY10_00760 [Chloroflexi bacterium ADurb.Bin180]HNR96945.1 crosslink repair DNA glycosylase YcaQ family protein [Anaerolineae bacterium]
MSAPTTPGSPEPVSLKLQTLDDWRNERYRRRPDLRLRSRDQALAFINDVGFCFTFHGRDAEAPSLFEAVCGERRAIVTVHDDADLGRTWHWKDELPASGAVYYAKLLRKRPTLISLDLLPYFYALSPNYGDIEDYILEYQEGHLSDEARRVYETLLSEGAMPTSHLRRKAGLEGERNALRFDRAVRELQISMKIAVAGISDANRWGYCFVYDVVLRRWPDLPKQAGAISSREAKHRLTLAHLRNVGAARLSDLTSLFGWDKAEFTPLVSAWVATGELLTGGRMDGFHGEYLVWPELIQAALPRPKRRSRCAGLLAKPAAHG